MKYITLIIGLLVVGCGKTAEEKMVGTYEARGGGDTYKQVLLENGVLESYINDKQREGDFKWSISEDGELHIVDKEGIVLFRINKDGSLTNIAIIDKDGPEDYPKEDQLTWTKTK